MRNVIAGISVVLLLVAIAGYARALAAQDWLGLAACGAWLITFWSLFATMLRLNVQPSDDWRQS